jgi:glucose-6-phosphate isomerase
VIVSKTFTTAETMLNARTVRAWLTAKLGVWLLGLGRWAVLCM